VVSLLVRTGILSYEQLKSARRYVIVLAFVFGMFVAPDVISQTFLALPVWGLYEIGLAVARFI
jgi:sec-independent protein translocase protein TatC